MIVSFIGVIGSGKDYQAGLLQRQGFKRIDFKDCLLDMASDIAGYDVREDYEFFKENVVGVRRPANKFIESFQSQDCQTLRAGNPDMLTGRLLLQRLGTEVMRKRNEDYWSNEFIISAINYPGNIVNADCRFSNEVEAIKNLPMDSEFIFCDYRSPRYDPEHPHLSERLAQKLLALGLRDGQRINDGHFAAVL